MRIKLSLHFLFYGDYYLFQHTINDMQKKG